MTIAAIKTPPVVYPEPDGEPMAESDPARKYLVYGVEALQEYFSHRPDVYVTGNLWLSYTKGVPSAAVCPDVFIVFGVENRERQSYKVWEENGKTPDFVLEVTSKKTYRKDEEEKPDIYASLGVSEYFQYDPTGDYINPQIKGRRLVGSRYQVLTPSRTEDGTLVFFSVVLGLEMRLLPDGRLQFFDPKTGEYLRTPQESERERVREKELAAQERERAEREKELAARERERADREKERADREKELAAQERERAERLAARLLELGIDPDLKN